MSSELSAEDLVSVARFGGRLGDRGWHRFTATSLDDHTHTVPITQVPDPFPGVNVITQTQGVMSGEMSGSYTGINVARIHSATRSDHGQHHRHRACSHALERRVALSGWRT